jgi:hypothetical protein
MIRQLYTLLEQNVFYGDRLTERKFVTLLSPGQFISTNLKENNLNDQYSIWELTNKVMDTTFVQKFQPSTVSGIFGEIIQFVALPEKALSIAEQDRRDADIAVIDRLEDVYDKYSGMFDELSGKINREESKDNP